MAIIYTPGNEPEKIRKRLNTLFAKLDEAYPDKVIFGLYRDHKKWGETVVELYRLLGYENNMDFLNAYGYTVKVAEPKGAVGRQKTTDEKAIIKTLQDRYPNGASFKNLDELCEANPDFAAKKKTLANNASEYFGMPLGRYLISIGLLYTPPTCKAIEEPNYEEILAQYVEEVKAVVQGLEIIPDSVAQIDDSSFTVKHSMARKCLKKIANSIPLDNYLRKLGVISAIITEDELMQKTIEVLKARYEGSKNLPATIQELINDNDTLPIRRINKYIRNILATDPNVFYIKNKIMQRKRTDLLEFFYVIADFGRGDLAYLSKDETIKKGDFVLKNNTGDIMVGVVSSAGKYLGIDAPYNPEHTSYLYKKTNEEEILSGYYKISNLLDFSRITGRKISMLIKELETDEWYKTVLTEEDKQQEVTFVTKRNSKYIEPMFLNTVFRGRKKQIIELIEFISDSRVNVYCSFNETENIDVYETDVILAYDSGLVDDVLEKFPELKMAAFFDNGREGYICFSAPGASYVTDSRRISSLFHFTESPYMCEYSPLDSFKEEELDGKTGYREWVNYKFPFKKEWDAFE